MPIELLQDRKEPALHTANQFGMTQLHTVRYSLQIGQSRIVVCEEDVLAIRRTDFTHLGKGTKFFINQRSEDEESLTRHDSR